MLELVQFTEPCKSLFPPAIELRLSPGDRFLVSEKTEQVYGESAFQRVNKSAPAVSTQRGIAHAGHGSKFFSRHLKELKRK